MGHIFISYSHKDKDYVHKLQEAIQNEGFDVWIDDRIDYGTEWPKVIQKYLDECSAFIVVVSDNAYESKWVQNEVTRAERKKKPFFPLLLSGDPWLSVETTQYVDVREEKLPPYVFFQKLEEFVERVDLKLSHDLSMVTSSWLTYTSPKNNFLFQYPPDGDIYRDEDSFICIWLPTIPGTNIASKQLTINCEKKTDVPNSPSPKFGKGDDFLVSRQIVKITGKKYMREVYATAGMGKEGELTKYSTLDTDVVTIFSLEIVIKDQGHHAYLLPKMDLAAERDVLLYVLHTFSWLSQP